MTRTWRDVSACRSVNPDLFQPDSADDGAVEQAKSICRRCPVADTCLRYALDHSIDEGVMGGLTSIERASLRRAIRRHRLTAADVAALAAQARQPQPPKPRTIREHLDRYTVRVWGGHLEWCGPKRPWIDGASYTPLQVAFIADRGRRPEGRIVAGCAHSGCIKAGHISDDAERRAYINRHLPLAA